MPPLYLVEQGAKLSSQSRRLVVTKGGEELSTVPLIKVSEVIIFGNVQLTTQVMKLLMAEGIDVVFLTMDGHYCGRLIGPQTKYGALRQAQYNKVNDKDYALATAQRIVVGKLSNLRTLLMRYNRALEDPVIDDVVGKLKGLVERAPRTTGLNSLLGVEGKGTALYFSVFKRLFKDEWSFKGRVRRPPTDPINVLLSFGYTLLTHNIEAAVNTVGLDPYLGFLHATEYGRPSLALDLVEEFRSIVVDSMVLRCCNSRLITEANFSKTEDAERPVLLDEEGRKRFIKEFEARLAVKFTHPLTKEQVTYRRCFELQVRQLARCLTTGEGYYQPFTVR